MLTDGTETNPHASRRYFHQRSVVDGIESISGGIGLRECADYVEPLDPGSPGEY